MQSKNLLLFLATALWCLVAIVPFASPVHYVPLPQWWGEILTVWLALGAGLCLIVYGKLFDCLPRASWWCLLLAMCWALQPYWVNIIFLGMNQATALAWLVMAMLAAVTFSLRNIWGLSRLTHYLAWALVIGALLQSLIGFTQLTGLAQMMNGLVFYDSAHPTSNIFGHIGQRNQYAHYLMWGMIGGTWLFANNRAKSLLYRVAFVLWTLWLSLMLAYAGSRTVLLYVVAIALIGIVWHGRIGSTESRRLMLSLLFACVSIVAFQFLMPWISHLMALLTHSHTEVASGIERLASNSDDMSSRRFGEMRKAWMVFLQHPYAGTGWSQFARQSVELQLLPQFARDGYNSGLFTNAHNLILQLLAEMGGIVTLIVLAGFCWVIWPFFSRKAEIEGLLPLACMAVTLIHSMLEYPLWYLYFLAMLVVFCALSPDAGALQAHRLSKPFRLVLQVLLMVVAGLSINSWTHYKALVSLYSPSSNPMMNQKRFDRLTAIIQTQPLYAYHALYDLDNYLDGPPAMLVLKQPWIDMLAAFRPYPDVLVKQAAVQAITGQPREAEHTMALALASFPTYAGNFINDLSKGPSAWQPLRQMASDAYRRLPVRYRGNDD